ncbi:MAG: carboxypeptidase M32 [Chloroflexi bacterium]|nr:carboxypeptidase M32 [Chloroflexota bacterium]
MEEKLQELKQHLTEVNDLDAAAGLLYWDQSTYMPPGGAPARARQLSTLRRLSHDKFTDPAIGKLLDELQPYADSLPVDHDDAALLRVARRFYERETKVPSSFAAEMSAHAVEAYQVWTAARPDNDFARVQPYLEKTLELSRQLANYFPGYDHIADPLINYSDYGMQAATLRQIFADLRAALVPMVQAITAQEPADDSCLRHYYPETDQLAFGLDVIKDFGYDFERGRQDKTHHPFATKFSIGDVRITTRAKDHYLAECLFSTLHESGHAMYEQGLNREYEGLPLGRGTSSGVHESQSRLWENVVGRSRGFWEHYYPALQQTFPEQLRGVSLDEFYRAINKVERSLIRTDADEVTYNLHVMLRFDFELALLEGEMVIADLPDAWNARFEEDFGITPPDQRDGVLQDVHWFAGRIGGAFQGYTLGNILSAQFYAAALDAHPDIPTQIGQGEFGTLHTWLRENIYQHGRKYDPADLVARVTGQPLTIAPYINYLRTKYGELYTL